VGLAHLGGDLLWESSCRNPPYTRRQRCWGGPGLCGEIFVDVLPEGRGPEPSCGAVSAPMATHSHFYCV